MHLFHRTIAASMLAAGIALLAACNASIERTDVPTALVSAATVQPTQTPTTTRTSTPTQTSTAIATQTPIPTQPALSPTDAPLIPTPTLAPLSAEQRHAIFEQAWTLVRDNYLYEHYGGNDWDAVHDEFSARVANAATEDIFYATMHELIERLGDKHSRFANPQQVAEQHARSSGEWTYAGIGVTIRDGTEGGIITQVVANGPAAEAGLRPRDLIVAVDGRRFTDTSAFGAGGPQAAVRGPPGTTVVLTVRSPDSQPREVQITRRVIPPNAFPPVEVQRLADTNIGVLNIATFEQSTIAEHAREQLQALNDAAPLDGLIIDVRENSGGYISAMLDTIALFVDGGSIGTSNSRTRQSPLNVPAQQVFEPLGGRPIVVLTSSETISAAEMFAAGLQALNRVRVVGTVSAGNTENLVPHQLADGSEIWLAEYAYRLPDGTTLEGRGVQPDRIVEANFWQYALGEDPQILAAQDELVGMRK